MEEFETTTIEEIKELCPLTFAEFEEDYYFEGMYNKLKKAGMI